MEQYKDLMLADLHNLIKSVKQEDKKQIAKWGIQTHSIFEWLTYTEEELGSLAKAVSEHEYRNGDWQKVYNEAIQVATLCLKIAEMIEANEKITS